MVVVDPLVLDQPALIGTSRETTLDAPVTPTYPAHCLIFAATRPLQLPTTKKGTKR